MSVETSTNAINTSWGVEKMDYSSVQDPDTTDDPILERKNVISLETKIVSWDCSEGFNRLTTQEKLYAHYMSKAAWYGALIIPVQTSPESPVMFSLLFDLFKTNTIERVKEIAVDYCFFWEEDWQDLLAYTCGIFCNGGNYLGSGDTKFIPGLSMSKLGSLITNENITFTGEDIRENWEIVKERVYSMTPRERQLGFWNKGVTTYFTPNCTYDDVALVDRFMTEYLRSHVNTRVFKHVPNTNPLFTDGKPKDKLYSLYEVRMASVLGDPFGFKYSPHYEFGDTEFVISRCDYVPMLKDVRHWLTRAKQFATNDHQREMLEELLNTFYTGDIEQHKEATRHWLLDKDSSVEAYLGFIETYRDPDDQRAEFQGFVLIDDPELNDVLDKMAFHSKAFLTKLPWPREFERDVFKRPNFSAKEALTCAASSILDSINVPTYPDVRSKNGFKNFALQKVARSLYEGSKMPFLSGEDASLYSQYSVKAHKVQLSIHEILGHGSGKLFVRNRDGTTNFPRDLLNPITGEYIDSMYEIGETYDSLFPSSFSDSMEECRAECVGLYLSLDDEVLKVFGYEGEEAEVIRYINWLDFVYAGATVCLRSYLPDVKQWKTVQEQAKFAILRVLIDAKQELVTIDEVRDEYEEPDLRIKLDRRKLQTVGRKAVGDLLVKLQVYKATANVQHAQRFYRKITSVNNKGVYPWLKWREIVLEKEEPQRLFVQPNTFITEDKSDVRLVLYDATFEGFIKSWLERYDDNGQRPPSLYDQLDECWLRDKDHFFPNTST